VLDAVTEPKLNTGFAMLVVVAAAAVVAAVDVLLLRPLLLNMLAKGAAVAVVLFPLLNGLLTLPKIEESAPLPPATPLAFASAAGSMLNGVGAFAFAFDIDVAVVALAILPKLAN